MYFFKSEIYYTIQLHIILLYLFLFVVNISIFNFQKLIDMHKGYAYKFLILLFTKKNCNKEQRIKTPRTKPKLVGELNPNFMKNFAQLQHKFPNQPNPTQTHLSPQS
jgi:hypothetical protein